ncbi:MAG: sulfotransferase [Bacteroidota bacterium]
MKGKSVKVEVQNQLVKKKRPIPVAFYNYIGKKIGLPKSWGGLDENDLIRTARKKTCLNEFGDDQFLTPFRKLLESVKEEANLHPFGYFMLRIRMVDILSTRLKIEYFYKTYPEIDEIELSPVTLITGLQRTGTTKLQRLLAKDLGNRTLLSWEVLSPVPPKDFKSRKKDPRIADARFKEKFVRYIDPEFYKIHAVVYDEPEEEILLLDNAFLSTTPEAMFHVPAYASWLETQDQEPAYAYLKKQLKLLQWQNQKQRWILKTPHHLEFLPTLVNVFPDIKIIQTHRDPLKTLGSMCSLVEHTRSMFSDEVDLREIGRHWSRKTGIMVNNGLAFRDKTQPGRFLDVSYYDLIADTMKAVEKIYEFMEAPFSEEARKAMEIGAKVNPKNKFGKHKYTLEKYGLTAEKVDSIYKNYRAHFSIKYE